MTVILHELFCSVLTAANHQAGKIAQAAWTELACDLTPLHNSFRSPSGVTLHRTSSKEFGAYRQSRGIILSHGRENGNEREFKVWITIRPAEYIPITCNCLKKTSYLAHFLSLACSSHSFSSALFELHPCFNKT